MLSTRLPLDRHTRGYVKESWHYRSVKYFETSVVVRRFIASFRRNNDFEVDWFFSKFVFCRTLFLDKRDHKT